jgi:hypothetical protein
MIMFGIFVKMLLTSEVNSDTIIEKSGIVIAESKAEYSFHPRGNGTEGSPFGKVESFYDAYSSL